MRVFSLLTFCYHINMKKFIQIITVVLAIIVFALALQLIFGKPKSETANQSQDLITVELPYPDAVVGKEFSVIGKARGFWFFEASFPVQVIDKNGNILATAIAQAQKDPFTGEVNWMTENFVPFKADVKVPESYIGPATLVFKKDNPSGLPENDASFSFSINIEY